MQKTRVSVGTMTGLRPTTVPAGQGSLRAQSPSATAGWLSSWARIVGLGGCFLWSYWPILSDLHAFWSRDADYSAGQLVPLVSLYLCWRERAFLRSRSIRPSLLWGAALLLLAEGLRLGAVYYGFGSIERITVVVSIAGVVLLAAGWEVFWRLRWVLLFLVLMFPLPGRVHEAVALPLQQLATTLAAFLLELCGFFVVREGHVLRLDADTIVGVTEACSGLRMLTAFLFVSAVLAFLIRRPRWQKALLIASGIPIAVLSNGLRSAATGVFVYYSHNPELSDRFHDLAGLAMMPIAIALSVVLLKFLALLSDSGSLRRPTAR